MGITYIVPTPDNYGSFVDLVKKASRRNIPRGCRTSYIYGLTDESEELYEEYKMQFENDPFNSETTETGNRLSDEISEVLQKKWQTLNESTDFTHSSRKAWKTINKLSKDYKQLQQQCKVTADQMAHQLLLNGKGNSTHPLSKAKITDNHITEHSLTSLFTMEEMMKGINILKNNKDAGLDAMLCEPIKHLGPKATVWLRDDEQHPCVKEVSKFQSSGASLKCLLF